MRRLLLSCSLLFASLPVFAGCAPKQTVTAVPPPAAPERATLSAEVVVAVRTSPDLAQFRQIFERELGRSGFRVLPAPEAGVLLLNLIGDGNTTSGVKGTLSTVNSTMIVEMSVSFDGRLQGEHKSTTSYVAVYDRNDKSDDFNRFNARVGDYVRQSFEWLAIDLTNKLIATLPAAPAAAPAAADQSV
ncbi:MAG: hypothetical protein JNL82_20795 [Myxococcales bacterium]|nr:hypothetical protein [Myxococcales bacterium]